MRAALAAIGCAVALSASALSALAQSAADSDDRAACVETDKQGDDLAAVEPCLAAAEQGDVDSQLILARLCMIGSVARATGEQVYVADPAAAMKWCRRAADQGSAKAQVEVGQLYAEGKGVPQDYAEAAKWYRRAADQENIGGQLYLGVLYEYGRGVSKDFVQAYKWYALAAGHPGRRVPNAERNRDYSAGKMSPAQLTQAQELVAAWRPQ